MDEKSHAERSVEIVRDLSEVLEEGEIAFVITKDGKGVYAFPSETEAKARVAELSLSETFNILSKAMQFTALALAHHEKNVRAVEPASKLVVPGAPKIVGAH